MVNVGGRACAQKETKGKACLGLKYEVKGGQCEWATFIKGGNKRGNVSVAAL